MAVRPSFGIISFIGIILVGSIVAGATIPLAIIPAEVTIKVTASDTGVGIGGAIVKLDWHELFHDLKGETTWDYTIATDSYGQGVRNVAVGTYTIEVSASGFATKTIEKTKLSEGSQTLQFTLERTASVSGKTVKFYCRDGQNEIVSTCIGEFQGAEYPASQNGVITIFDVSPGTYTITFDGRYKTSDSIYWTNFRFTSTFTVPLGIIDPVEYSVWVQSRTVENSKPPAPPVDPWAFVTSGLVWLISNPLVLGTVLVGLYVFTIMFMGSGPELLRMGVKKR